MRFHWQNLNERSDRPDGTILKHGRAWLHLGQLGLNWEWVLFGRTCGIALTLDDDCEDTVSGHVQLPLLLAFYWTVEHPALLRLVQRLVPKYQERQLSLRVHDWAVWWNVWHPACEWRSGTPRWRSGSWHVLDTLLGKVHYQSRVVEEERPVQLHLPEGIYEARVSREECTWKRPRWFTDRRFYYEVKVEGGVPVPGKGESSWDCGQDAVFSRSSRAASREQAAEQFVASVLETRERRGGKNWRPTERQTA